MTGLLFNPMFAAKALTADVKVATIYCAERKADTERLAAELSTQTYADVRKVDEVWFVDGRECAGFPCMLAYILKKYW